MWRRGREADPAFDPAERLFCWLRLRNIASNERLLALLSQLTADEESDAAVRDAVAKELMPQLQFPRFPRQSLNRGKYGESTDVLWPSQAAEPIDEPVLAFRVAEMTVESYELQAPRKGAPSPGWLQVGIEHCPLDDNYGHCEMNVVRNTEGEPPRVLGPDDGGDVPPALKSAWRRQISRRCRVVYMPPAAGA